VAKYWDLYEIEFERVARKLPTGRKTEILESLREHVDEAVRSLSAEGKSVGDAEQEAIRQLGPPSEVVRIERDSPRSSWLPVWATWLGLAWCSAWAIVGWRELTPYMALVGAVITPLAVLITTLIGKKTKLWAMGLACAMLTVATVAGSSLTWRSLKEAGGTGYMPMLSYANEMKLVRSRLSDMNQKRAVVLALGEAFAKGDVGRAAQLCKSKTGFWTIPTGRYSSSSFLTFEDARKRWSLKSALNEIDEERRELANVEAMVRDARSFQPLRFFLDGLPIMLSYGLTAFAVLAMVHILGLACVRLTRALRRARWRRAIG